MNLEGDRDGREAFVGKPRGLGRSPILRRVAFVALVFLPACGGCSSCSDDPEQVRATKELSGPIEAPRGTPSPSDSSPIRFFRPAFRHRFPHDAGAKVASDAAIE